MTTEDRGPQLRGVAIGMLVFAIVSFSQRAFVRTYMVKAFGIDDWLMLGAMIAFIFFVTCVVAGTIFGTGRHMAELPLHDQQTAMMYWFYCYIGYCWTMILSKLSIGAFLLRIVVAKLHRWTLYIAIFINILTGLIFFFVTMLQCHPISYFWDTTTQSGSCISIDIIIALTYLYSAFNIICDFTFALLPIAIVQGLNMHRRMKIAIVPLLGMGCIASSAVVVRLAYVETFRNPDFLWATVDIAIWSTVEGGLAIAAGSLACGRPLFKVILSRLGFSSAPYVVPSNGALGGGRPTGGSGIPLGSRRSKGTELLSMGCMVTATGGPGSHDSSEDLKLTSPTTNAVHGDQKLYRTPITVTTDISWIEERKEVGKSPLEHPRRGGSSASDGSFSSRRELRLQV